MLDLEPHKVITIDYDRNQPVNADVSNYRDGERLVLAVRGARSTPYLTISTTLAGNATPPEGAGTFEGVFDDEETHWFTIGSHHVDEVQEGGTLWLSLRELVNGVGRVRAEGSMPRLPSARMDRDGAQIGADRYMTWKGQVATFGGSIAVYNGKA